MSTYPRIGVLAVTFKHQSELGRLVAQGRGGCQTLGVSLHRSTPFKVAQAASTQLDGFAHRRHSCHVGIQWPTHTVRAVTLRSAAIACMAKGGPSNAKLRDGQHEPCHLGLQWVVELTGVICAVYRLFVLCARCMPWYGSSFSHDPGLLCYCHALWPVPGVEKEATSFSSSRVYFLFRLPGGR